MLFRSTPVETTDDVPFDVDPAPSSENRAQDILAMIRSRNQGQ